MDSEEGCRIGLVRGRGSLIGGFMRSFFVFVCVRNGGVLFVMCACLTLVGF